MDIPNLTYKKEEDNNHQNLRIILLGAILILGLLIFTGWILNEKIGGSLTGVRNAATGVKSVQVATEPAISASDQFNPDRQRVYSAGQINLQPFRPAAIIYSVLGLLFVLLVVFVLIFTVYERRDKFAFLEHKFKNRGK